MSDHNDRHPSIHLLEPPKRHAALRAWDSLSSTAKGIGLLVGFAAIVAAGVRGCDAMASDDELAAHVAEEQDAYEKLDGEVDLLWQTQVRVTTDVEALKQQSAWSNEVLFRIALDQGLRVQPPPTPAPMARATPVQTSARPTPTPGGDR